jgi:glutathione peroxidase
MNLRQKFLKKVYPLFMRFTKKSSRGKILENGSNKKGGISFYDLKALTNINRELGMEAFKGRYLLVVNTASECGYTRQFEELQKLYEKFSDRLMVLGFPANDFKEQEKGSDEQIAAFCKVNFGVTFPLMKKSSVVKGGNQHPVFAWLSHANQNGWNDQEPEWNFSKYLISKEGVLTHYFGPSVSPLDDKVIQALK